MALTNRITLLGPELTEPEDLLSSALGVIFPDDVTNQHGDPEHAICYTSPHLPRPLEIRLADARSEDDRQLFSHFLWNASLLLAELVEAGTLGVKLGEYTLDEPVAGAGAEQQQQQQGVNDEETGSGDRTTTDIPEVRTGPHGVPVSWFNVRGLSTLELGAGTALPSLLGALLGASRVAVTDYPSETVMEMLKANMVANGRPEYSPASCPAPVQIEVEGHAWGDKVSPFAAAHRRAFDRVLACDCLWMPWQHANLRESVSWFLADGPSARAWVVGGFHTGRAKMSGFFDEAELRAVDLEVESIWERDCDGQERPWVLDRGPEDPGERKRWLVVAVLRRVRGDEVEVPAGQSSGNGDTI
jgi:EEF1A N-terminal glycine/lysine methyltransferase